MGPLKVCRWGSPESQCFVPQGMTTPNTPALAAQLMGPTNMRVALRQVSRPIAHAVLVTGGCRQHLSAQKDVVALQVAAASSVWHADAVSRAKTSWQKQLAVHWRVQVAEELRLVQVYGQVVHRSSSSCWRDMSHLGEGIDGLGPPP